MDLDHVDRLLRIWEVKEPTLDMSVIEVAGRLLRCAGHLTRFIEAAFRPLGLTFGDFDVINALRREGDGRGINPKLLADYALITSGAMTARLDRLERLGLIARHPDPSDRRSILVQLTPTGEKVAHDALRTLLEADRVFLTPLNRNDRTAIALGLRKLLVRNEAR